ncbi:MAG: glycosyltransferase, partial [Anaerolineae bacterium]|nr:glycosyltransferase [Anaerolineae bacterium]
MLIDALVVIYVLAALALAGFASGIWVLLALWLRHRGEGFPTPDVPAASWPSVTVQLPLYNEQAVVRRLLAAAAALDYPRDRLRVQVLDDSDDDTADLVARLVRGYRASGLDIRHVRRADRAEYKAGALAHALAQTGTDLIAVFDADFVPPPDFLRRAAPHFATDPALGFLQARWGHLNAGQNLITRSQAMSIDGHFIIEQMARSRGGLLMSFNGTGGIWRADCIRDAGGWSGRTLAEDLDLSYRAQLRGWKVRYLPEVEVPAELPPQVAAYKRQQSRWATGTTQGLRLLLGPAWRSDRLNLGQKLMATLHLCQYLPQPFLLVMAVLTPVLMLAGALDRLPLAPLGVIGLGPVLMYVLGQRHLYRDWPHRLVALPLLVALGSGVIFSNSVAVMNAFRRRAYAFKRTPKFSDRPWQGSGYALRIDWTTAAEGLLALYLLLSGIVALRLSPGIAPFLFGQAFGFGAMVAWSL